MLRNWKATTKYFQSCTNDIEANGFFIIWTDKRHPAFNLLTDRFVFSLQRFHQGFEDDNILIFDIGKRKNTLVARLDESKTSHWRLGRTISQQLDVSHQNDTTIYKLFDVSLKQDQRRSAHNELVSKKRGFDEIRY